MLEKIDQTYKNEFDKVEQEKLAQLAENAKLREKRIQDENEARRKLDKIHKNKITEAEKIENIKSTKDRGKITR